MPWKSKTPVDLRIEFMKRVLKGETVAELCREFGISRKTGDKFKLAHRSTALALSLGFERSSVHPQHREHRHRRV